jgi:hypothetical protein
MTAKYHYFAGANTPAGFFSYFDNIISYAETNKKIYIKGGSGTGKSTLMNKTAVFFEAKGYNTEYFHCSNDAESIDGINIIGAGIAVVDGTSPHPADPRLSFVKDEIFNASDFLDKDYINENRENLIKFSAEKKNYYGKAYSYLSAAYEIYKINERLYKEKLDSAVINAKILDVLKIFKEIKPLKRKAWDRKLFITAITPDGIKSYAESALKAGKTYILNGIGVMGIFEMLDCVQKTANLYGLDTISFKSPLAPDKTGHLYIPALNIAFVSTNKYHIFNCTEAAEHINFGELSDVSDELTYNSNMFDELLQKAINMMQESKLMHNKMEDIYSKGMDFEGMHRVYNGVLEWLGE